MSRITKAKIIGYFSWLRQGIYSKYQFKFNNGTSQLGAKTAREKKLVDHAVQYGRAEAFEQIMRMLQENDELIVNFDVEKGEPRRSS